MHEMHLYSNTQTPFIQQHTDTTIGTHSITHSHNTAHHRNVHICTMHLYNNTQTQHTIPRIIRWHTTIGTHSITHSHNTAHNNTQTQHTIPRIIRWRTTIGTHSITHSHNTAHHGNVHTCTRCIYTTTHRHITHSHNTLISTHTLHKMQFIQHTQTQHNTFTQYRTS